MTKSPFKVKARPISDWIIIERLDIKTINEKKAAKVGLIKAPGAQTPKNAMELERQKSEEYAKYEVASEAILKMWDEHPNQGIVISVGQGRAIEEDIKIKVEIKPGDHIYYRGKSGEPIVLNKRLYWVIKEYDVFAVKTE